MFSLAPGYYGSAGSPRGTAGAWQGLGVSVFAHGLLLALAMAGFSYREQLVEMAKPIAVSLIEAMPRSEPPPRQPLPKPKVPAASVPKAVQATPVPVMVAPSASTTAPGLSIQPTAAAPQVADSGPLVEARFDADYLSNPKPPYPAASRRLSEVGTVYLRVQVSAEGAALTVELKKTSGFARLDQSALETVARWRFTPARRGSVPVNSWVVVPIVFSLT